MIFLLQPLLIFFPTDDLRFPADNSSIENGQKRETEREKLTHQPINMCSLIKCGTWIHSFLLIMTIIINIVVALVSFVGIIVCSKVLIGGGIGLVVNTRVLKAFGVDIVSEYGDLNFTWLTPLVITVTVCLSFILVICILGVVAIRRRSKCLLIINCWGMTILFFALSVTFVITYFGRSVLRDIVYPELRKQIHVNYEGLDGKTRFTVLMNVIMLAYNCCGIRNYSDFEGAKRWNGRSTITLNNIVIEKNVEMPIPCCSNSGLKSLRDLIKNTTKPTRKTLDKSKRFRSAFNCARIRSRANFQGVGCLNVMWEMIERSTRSPIAFAVIISLIFGVALALITGVLTLCHSRWSEEESDFENGTTVSSLSRPA